MGLLAPSTNLHGWRPPVDREAYFDAEIKAFRATLADVRSLPQTLFTNILERSNA